jgi:hypothetical protein
MDGSWLDRLRFSYKSSIANLFLLHFNVNDYMGPGNRRVRDVLIQDFLADPVYRRLVAVYNRAEGITFPKAAMRTEFLELLTGQSGAEVEEVRLPVLPGQVFTLLDKLLYARPSGSGA